MEALPTFQNVTRTGNLLSTTVQERRSEELEGKRDINRNCSSQVYCSSICGYFLLLRLQLCSSRYIMETHTQKSEKEEGSVGEGKERRKGSKYTFATFSVVTPAAAATYIS